MALIGFAFTRVALKYLTNIQQHNESESRDGAVDYQYPERHD